MDLTMLDGVLVTTLHQFLDARGKVMHMLRSTDTHFESFGEIYFSTVYPGVVKAWHLHKRKTINLAVPVGVVKLVMYDPRAESATAGQVQEIFLGPENYCLVTVPPGLWYGFQGIGIQTALVANCCTLPYDPLESDRKDPITEDIPYTW